MTYKTPNTIMGISVVSLQEALEFAYTEHGLDWFESGAAYEYDSGDYEAPATDWEALDWAYGVHKWDVFPTGQGLGTEGHTEAVGETLRDAANMGVKYLFLASPAEIDDLIDNRPEGVA